MKNSRRNIIIRGGQNTYCRMLAVLLSICMLFTVCPIQQVYVQAVSPSPDSIIASNQEWDAQILEAGTYTINPGVTVTVSGKLTVNGAVTIKGGGTLVRKSSYKGSSSSGSASGSCMFYVSGGTLTLENITIDGDNVEAYGAAVYINSGTVNMKTGAVIKNNINVNEGTTGVNAAGGVYCGGGGTLNIDGGTIQNCRTSKTVGSSVYSHAGGGIYLKGTCNMTAGSITGNGASNGGGIYLASTDAVLRLSGGVISGNSATGDGAGIFYSTENNATSKVYIGGMANVKDVIYLDNRNGTMYPYITSTVRYPVTLSCNSTTEGRILAGGDGYTLTSVDASKISMTGTSLYSRLNKANNQIYLSTTEEPEAMWQESSGGAWKQGKFTTALAGVYDGGTIKLLTAVVITEKAEIKKTVTITSNNASDPCVMTRMPVERWGNITINGGHLTLTNVIYDGNRDWIQGTEDAKKQSLIKVGNNADDTGAGLTLGEGAVVRDGYKSGGSGLFAVYGTMVMNSGAVIDNCEVTGTGGGIWVASNGNFVMNGGTIRGCKAAGGGSAISNDGTCTLKGGSITGNTDTSDKNCAVYLRNSGNGKLTMNGITIADNEYSVYNDGKSVSVTGDSALSDSIYTTNAITASDKAVSSLTKMYTIMWSVSPAMGTIVVEGSKDVLHYQLANAGYGLNPASDGSSNLIVAQKYKVSFNKNGGSGTASDIEVICGGIYGQLPSLTRTGYTFDGWYTAATGGSLVKSDTVVTATAAHTLYARWTANTYTVTYNKNSGTIANESNYKSYTYGTGLTLPKATRTGYTFDGWYTTSTFTGTKVTSISGTETGNKTYYAKWTANTYTVTYNKNSGTIASESNYKSYTYGTGLTLPKATRTGYTFDGWYTTSTFTGTKVTGISGTETGNKTYYAKWTDNIAPVIGALSYSYEPVSLWHWLFGKDSLTITVPVTEEGSGADELTYTMTPEGGTASTETAALTNGVAKLTISADFKGTVAIACTDKAGNTSASVTVGAGLDATGIIIEDHAPQVAFQVDGSDVSMNQYETSPAVTVTVTDDKDDVVSAGIASVTYRIGNNAEVIVPQDFTTTMKTSATFIIPAEQIPEGETVITVKAEDNAGNMIASTQTVKVKTDGEKDEEARKAAEEKVAAAKAVVAETLAGITVTNDTTKENIQEAIDTALMETGMTGVTVTVSDLEIEEATKDAPGSVSGTVSIVSDTVSDVTDSVTISETIAQIPLTDEEKAEIAKKAAEEKVAAVKAVVEQMLAGFTVTNDTTKESIQEAIDTALMETGMTDVTVTVSDLKIEEATSDAPGNVSGTVSIVSGDVPSVTDSVIISGIITKLPEAKPEPPVHTHTYTWIITKEATLDEAGEITGTCTCSEVTTAVIPKTGDGGSGMVVVKEDAENECKGTLSDKADVKGKVSLTDAEKEQLNTGEDLVIILRLKDRSVAADTPEKTEIQKNLGINTLGTFLDIELLKEIGGTQTRITETTDKIAITFEVPEHIRNTDDTVTRTYQIMRNHDGLIETLDIKNYDEATNLLTFHTDKFSTYALVYRDTVKDPAEGTQVIPGKEDDKVVKGEESALPSVPSSITVSKEAEEQNALFLNIKLKVSQTGKKINIVWGEIAEADGYDVYVQYCGKDFTEESITAIKNGKTTKAAVKEVNGKPLNLKKNYKLYVLAYKLVDGKKVILGKTVTAHIVGRKNTKYTNVKAVRVKKNTYSLERGKTATIKASTVLVSKGKKQLTDAHAKEFRYATTNKRVATVSSNGKIKAIGKGSCTIYVYARNGYAKAIKVKVR